MQRSCFDAVSTAVVGGGPWRSHYGKIKAKKADDPRGHRRRRFHPWGTANGRSPTYQAQPTAPLTMMVTRANGGTINIVKSKQRCKDCRGAKRSAWQQMLSGGVSAFTSANASDDGGSMTVTVVVVNWSISFQPGGLHSWNSPARLTPRRKLGAYGGPWSSKLDPCCTSGYSRHHMQQLAK